MDNQSMQTPFSDSGFNDILVGGELFKALKIAPQDFNNPEQFAKIREIASFLNQHPDPSFVINRIKNNRSQMSNIDFLHSYVGLNKQKYGLQQQLESLDKEIKRYE